MKMMKRVGLVVGGLVAVLAPEAEAASAALQDGTFAGGTHDAYFGPLQVEVTVQGGQVTGVKALQFPQHRRTSVLINQEALPYLEEEAITAQSARIDIVSGATLTSRAYAASLGDALVLSKKGKKN